MSIELGLVNQKDFSDEENERDKLLENSDKLLKIDKNSKDFFILEDEDSTQISEKEEEEKVIKDYETKKNLLFEQKRISIFRLIYHLSTKFELFLISIGIFTSLFSGLGASLISILFGGTINNFSQTQNPEMIIQKLEKTTNTSLKNFFIASIGMFISGFIKNITWNYSSLLQMYHLKEKYFKIILSQEQGWFDQNNAFEFATKVQAQLEQIEMGIGDSFGYVFQAITQLISGLIISFSSSWKFTLVMFSFTPIIFGFFILLFKRIKRIIILSKKTYEKAGGIAEELLYNVKTVASFSNFDFENKRYGELIDKVHQYQYEISYKLGASFGFLFLLCIIIFVIAILYGRKLIIDKEWNNTTNDYFRAGDILTVIMSSISSISSIGGIGPNLKVIKDSSAASSDYFTLVDRKPQINLSISNYKTYRDNVKGKVEFKNISFFYPSDTSKKKVLDGINLIFEPGKQIALVGESGCGKSTIVNLIERLYEAERGEILIDGINIIKYDIKFLRSIIGYVQQEPVLFNKSIKDNLIFGREGLIESLGDPTTLIKNACEDAFANEFIFQNDEKYDYIVGIKGSKLSGGQKQRIAIARAILCKPKILILDEATSALDNKSEKEVQKALDNLNKKDVTTIIIAHRLSTIRNADLIYVIKDGKVFESGTHQELLKKNGHYADLIRAELKKSDKLGYKEQKSNEKNKKEAIKCLEGNHQYYISNKDEEKLNTIDKNVTIDRRKIWSLLKNDKGKVLFGSISSFLAGGIFPITGLLFSSCITTLSKLGIEKAFDEYFYWFWIIVLFAVINGTLIFFKVWIFQIIGSIITSQIRKKVISKYLQLHMSFFDYEKNSPGALITKLSLDTTQLSFLILKIYGEIIGVIGTCIIGIFLGFYFSWRLTIIEFCFIPISIILHALMRKTRRGGREKERKIDIESGAFLSECVINTKTIFSFDFQDKAVKMYLSILEPQKKNFLKDVFLRSFLIGVNGFINFIFSTIIFKYSFKFIKEGKLTFGDMVASLSIVSMLGGGITHGLSGLVDYNKAKNSFISIFGTLDIKSEIDVSPEANLNKKSAKNISGKIEFKNVSFAYPTKPNHFVLKDVSFEINAGQSAALVGYSGSGKSTIIQLLERFYDVKKGEILIDGINIKEYNINELRKKIGLVLQEPTLFKRSLFENVKYGNLNATKEQIIDAVNKAKITKYFKGGKNGEKEDPVSGGEKQRIAIARAFLKNPNILLLDEATSALDKETEVEVQKSIEELQKGRTSIVVAHRLSTIENSDIIFVLESGKIVEKGTHRELMELNGEYAALYQYVNQ